MKQETECCYSCSGCKVVDKICTIKNRVIGRIYNDVCELYSPRKLDVCVLCKQHRVNLKQHVIQFHKITWEEYLIRVQNISGKRVQIKRGDLF